MEPIRIDLGKYGYLAYLWADNLKKFVKLPMSSVDINVLHKDLGIAHIQNNLKEKNKRFKKGQPLVLMAVLVDIDTGLSLFSAEDRVQYDSKSLVALDQRAIDGFMESLSEIPVDKIDKWYSETIDDLAKKISKRPMDYYKYDLNVPSLRDKFTAQGQKWMEEIK